MFTGGLELLFDNQCFRGPAEANESVHADSATDARSVVDHFSSSKKNGSERSFQIDSFPVEPFVFCLAQWTDPL